MDWLYLTQRKNKQQNKLTITLSQHVYSYFHLLGNWKLVWLFGSTGVMAGILHFLLLMAGKHQTSGYGTGIVLKVKRILRCHLILNCKCLYEQLDKLTKSHKRLREELFWPQVSSPFRLKWQICHVRYINILTWLRDFQDKLLYLVLFSLYPSLFWELRDKTNLKIYNFDP